MLTKFLADLFRMNSYWWEGRQFLNEKNVPNIFNTDILFQDESNEPKAPAVNIASSNVGYQINAKALTKLISRTKNFYQPTK